MNRSTTIVTPGFKFAGISAGIKESNKKDLALIFSEKPALIAGVFTTNKIKAAPVKLSIERLSAERLCQAIVVNSGNANACTGKQGIRDARTIIEKTARELNISSRFVHVSSTGIIGKPLPIKEILVAIPELIKSLSPYSINDAATAIMTTDTFEKVVTEKIKIGNKKGTITGIAKGAGMICPSMATMLCFIVTDISINHSALDSALRDAVKKSFNRLTVDNDMSTNDTVMIMANGLLGNTRITKRSLYYKSFKNVLNKITHDLACMIARDGEGATKLIKIIVKGAKTESDAEKVAKAISKSLLVRTALYGEDPNWGRIMAATGYSGADVKEQKIDIYLNRIKLVSKGVSTNKDKIAKNILAGKEITITVNLGIGSKTANYITCDLTEEYIKINAHYTT
jgi:glutamate N-acetyltransferase/amino-acid N-acetyltransferase